MGRVKGERSNLLSNPAVITRFIFDSKKTIPEITIESKLSWTTLYRAMRSENPVSLQTAMKLRNYFGDDAVIVTKKKFFPPMTDEENTA